MLRTVPVPGHTSVEMQV
ncbi:hypothetical protein P5673_032444 [Acropora cervicornis]|uniref:Uncharacterized protein n=1 Tax=Acropora cervicornis TaxID=6130 RepID=A0AAD9PRF2_ACRCE|nr:hypothetical protein P5673_032444 [Acropora cervicornis]